MKTNENKKKRPRQQGKYARKGSKWRKFLHKANVFATRVIKETGNIVAFVVNKNDGEVSLQFAVLVCIVEDDDFRRGTSVFSFGKETATLDSVLVHCYGSVREFSLDLEGFVTEIPDASPGTYNPESSGLSFVAS